MKTHQIEELDNLSFLDFANIFNVYDEAKLGSNYKTYSINRTLKLSDLDTTTNRENGLFHNYVVEEQDTWPLISYKFYKDIRLWWLIANLNEINNPTIDPVPGQELKILKSDFVNEILRTIRDQ